MIRRLLVVTLLLVLSQAGYAQTWDAAADFSSTSNPNGVWAYGWTFNSPFNVHTQNIETEGGLRRWNSEPSQNYWLAAYYNPTPSALPDGGCPPVDWCVQPGDLALHPGPEGQRSLVRFTAPATGIYEISADFSAIDEQAIPNTIDVRIDVNGAAIFTGFAGPVFVGSTFTDTIPLSAGDAVDFSVGFGINSEYGHDGTRLAAVLTRTGDDGDGDGDGVVEDLCPGTAAGDLVDANGCSDAQVDGDGDGVCDPDAASDGPSMCSGSDNCPDDYNPGQQDFDEDGLGNVCDPDDDDDGDPDATDCNDFNPSVFTGATEICTDGVDNNCNGQVDEQAAGADCDADGVPNELDNCPLDFNEFQEDLDGDGLGDVCDADVDGDGVLNDQDNCPANANPGQQDFDGDGAGDACDADADADGLDDATEDLCLFTTTDPAAGVPSKSLGKNRWAEMDGNAQFDTNGNNPTGRMFSIYSTGGCSCAQILAICGYGEGHTKFGCSNSVMDWWTGLYDRAGEAPYQCKDD